MNINKQHLLLIFLLMPAITRAQTDRYHSDDLITVAEFGSYQPIGVTVSPDNRLFVAFPRRGTPHRFDLTEIIDGKPKPYPDAEWNNPSGNGQKQFASVQDLYADTEGFLWVLDSKPAPGGNIFGGGSQEQQEGVFKLLKIGLKNDKVERIYYFENLDKARSGLNDVRVDTEKQLAYLSDPGQAAIVVLDLKTGKSRTVLVRTEVTLANPDIIPAYDGKEMRNQKGDPFVSNVNGIALTRDNRYFYFKPINQYKLYRIETRYLANEQLSDADLLEKVETAGEVGITHGLEADVNGNIFLTTSTDYSIKYLSKDGRLHTLVQDSRLLWPDSFGVGSDGYLYFSCAQLQREAQWNNGETKTELPYRVYKVKLPQ